ncbi:MAG: GntR family transcriptional regulator [Glaciihabitans sp.]|nr:GntR family transcriptional regulator [Glaciihabitans sp.]
MPDGNALVDDLAARIREKIMSGEIPIGAPLRQAELAEAFGISRTPVREALRQLQSGGLIEVVPNRGAVVRVPVPWEVREVYEIRAELEALAARRSVERLDPPKIAELRAVNDRMYQRSLAAAAAGTTGSPFANNDGSNDAFHTLVYEASGNTRLARMLAEINDAFPRNVSALVLIDNPRHRDENFAEHRELVDALEAGDADKAANIMRSHVLSAGNHLAHWYERRSSTVFTGGPLLATGLLAAPRATTSLGAARRAGRVSWLNRPAFWPRRRSTTRGKSPSTPHPARGTRCQPGSFSTSGGRPPRQRG